MHIYLPSHNETTPLFDQAPILSEVVKCQISTDDVLSDTADHTADVSRSDRTPDGEGVVEQLVEDPDVFGTTKAGEEKMAISCKKYHLPGEERSGLTRHLARGEPVPCELPLGLPTLGDRVAIGRRLQVHVHWVDSAGRNKLPGRKTLSHLFKAVGVAEATAPYHRLLTQLSVHVGV